MFGLGWKTQRLCLAFFFFFFFCTRLWDLRLLFMHSSHKVWLFSLFCSQSEHTVYCLWTHKFHFSATFSLKMAPTVLFTYLKIILLQYFSIFNFNFQFSVVSKRTLSVNFAYYYYIFFLHRIMERFVVVSILVLDKFYILF